MPRATLEPANGDLDDEILRLIELKGGSPDSDLLKEMIKTALGLIDDRTRRGELKIVNSALHEMRDSFHAFAPYRHVRKVSIFGSARTLSSRPEYAQAREVGRLMSERGFMVITGAGGGIMRAANEGAGPEMSFGLHIRLPFEPVDDSLFAEQRLIKYKYFFTRKLTFVKETDGLILFPGGFGTLDECFEALTLIQTGKAGMLPVVFIDVPGGGYWKSIERHLDEHLVPRGLISPDDRNLFVFTEDPEEAVEGVVSFYRNYHSTRYVRETTVLRHSHPVDDALLESLNRDFADLLVAGSIERSAPLPDEANEPEILGLPRLVMRFNRRSFGRYRLLIDRLNQAAPAQASPAQAEPTRHLEPAAILPE